MLTYSEMSSIHGCTRELLRIVPGHVWEVGCFPFHTTVHTVVEIVVLVLLVLAVLSALNIGRKPAPGEIRTNDLHSSRLRGYLSTLPLGAL